jgi:AcrR family transcriptional regulator
MTRQYQLNQRAKSQAETRQRIVEAAIKLHQAKGLGATSMRDVAKEAGVGTVTVYRHFADNIELLGACSGAYFERHPFPDLTVWQTIPDTKKRLMVGLSEAYAFHRETSPMIARVLGEVRDLPIMEPYHGYWRKAADILLDAFSEPMRNDRKLKAGLVLALQFETWQVLTQQEELSDADAVDLMMRLLQQDQ